MDSEANNIGKITGRSTILNIKGKVNPRTGHEGADGEQMCSSTLS